MCKGFTKVRIQIRILVGMCTQAIILQSLNYPHNDIQKLLCYPRHLLVGLAIFE